MKQKLFNPDREPKCRYCEYGTVTANGETILCPKSGLNNPESFCKKYKYDPLKREPDAHPSRPDEFKY